MGNAFSGVLALSASATLKAGSSSACHLDGQCGLQVGRKQQLAPPSATTGTVSSPATSPAKPEILAPVTPPSVPLQPKTEILDSSATGGSLTTDGHDPILDPPPMPGGITTLVGGTISDVDRLRNH